MLHPKKSFSLVRAKSAARLALAASMLSATVGALATTTGCTPNKSPLAQDPDVPLAADEQLFQDALVLFDAGDFAGAQAKFDQLLVEHADSDRADNAAYLAGRCRYEQKLYADAITTLTAMRANHPTSPFLSSAAYFTGRSRFGLGDFAASVADFQAAVDTDATATYSDNAAYYVGRANYEAKSYAAAVTAFEAFETAYPDSTYADNGGYYHGRAYFDQQQFAQALPQFDRVLTISASLATTSIYADNATYYGARCHYGIGGTTELQAALPGFEAVVTNFPDSQYADNALYYEVRTYVDLQDCANAATALTRLQTSYPASTEITRATNYKATACP